VIVAKLSLTDEQAEALGKLIDRYLALPKDQQDTILAHVHAFFTFVSTMRLDSIEDSTKSLANSSAQLVTLTKSLDSSSSRVAYLTALLGALTVILIAETAVLIYLFH
jgi:hypothetical protein